MVSLHWVRTVSLSLSLLGDDGPKIRGWPGSGGDLAFRLVAEPDVSGRKHSLVLRSIFQQRET